MNEIKKYLRNLQTFVPWLQEFRFAVRSRIIKHFRTPPEDDFLLVHKFQPSEGQVFVDVGANRGDMILCMMLNKKLKNKIIAFEPNDIIYRQTSKRSFIRKNERVNLMNLGLGSEPGNLTLFTPQYRNWAFDGLSSFSIDSAESWLRTGMWNFREELLTIQKHECEVQTLDHFDLNPYFVKIDVEGFEYDVLQGSIKTIEKHKPLLLIEDITEEIEEFLTGYGYKFYGYTKGIGLQEGRGALNTFCLQPEHFEQLNS
jgi:FkbM family methyltransferase